MRTAQRTTGVIHLLILIVVFLAASQILAATDISFQNVVMASNYVNPYGSECATLLYTISADAIVTAKVWDSDDNVVKVLCKEESVMAGSHSVVWDGTRTDGAKADPGVYDICLVAFRPGASAVRSSATTRVVWPEADLFAQALTQTQVVGNAYPGDTVAFTLNGSPVGTTTATLAGNLFKTIDLSSLLSSNTLIATDTNCITGSVSTYTSTFPGIMGVSASPNPFTAGNSTTISYTLPSDMTVTVRVLDTSNAASLVKTLLDFQPQSAGQHSVTWDGKNNDGVLQCAGHHIVTVLGLPATGRFAHATIGVESPGPQIGDVAVADSNNSSVTITWATSLSSDSQILYGTTESLGLSTTLDPNIVTSHSVQVNGLIDGQTYYFRVASTDAEGRKSLSGIGTFKAAAIPSAPANLSATAMLHGVGLSWTVGGSDIAVYSIHRGTSEGFTCDDDNCVGTTDGETSFRDDRVLHGNNYYYKVRGKDHNKQYTVATSAASAEPLAAPSSVTWLEAEDAGGSATWTGTWANVSDSHAHGGAYMRSDGTTGCAVVFTVVGPEFELVTVSTDDGGVGTWSVDGQPQGDIDFSSNGHGSKYNSRMVVSGLANCAHSVNVVYKEPGAGGSSATHINVDVVECHGY